MEVLAAPAVTSPGYGSASLGGALEQQGGVAARWEEGDTATFDYVVVGAGSAGCLLTHRLCGAGHTVCLLEAGGSVAADTHTSVHGTEPCCHSDGI